MPAVRWLDPVRWLDGPSGQLGLFDQPSIAQCRDSYLNQNACYVACIPFSGWNLLLMEPCKAICMTESCGNGILVSGPALKKAMGQYNLEQLCQQACAIEASQISDPIAREVALNACPKKCQIAVGQSSEPTPSHTPTTTQLAPQPTAMKEVKTERPVWPWVVGAALLLGGAWYASTGGFK